MEEKLSKDTLDRIVNLGRQAGTIHHVERGTAPFVVIPTDCKVESLERLIYNDNAAHPMRKKGTVTVLDAASFCEYYVLFHDEMSRVFADETKGSFLAVLDYHATGENGPRWGQHRLSLTLRHSEEWKVWSGKDGEHFGQMDFAEFIEDNQPDISDPSGATMLEVARDLQAKSSADFSSVISQANGSAKFQYTETVRGAYGSGDIEIPERFRVTIPIYIGSDPITLTARLRYRLNSGKLVFWYDLLRASNAERDGFMTIHNSISRTLDATIINGAPA